MNQLQKDSLISPSRHAFRSQQKKQDTGILTHLSPLDNIYKWLTVTVVSDFEINATAETLKI